MRELIFRLIRSGFSLLEGLAPALAGRMAVWLFFRPFRKARPRRELGVWETAEKTDIPFTGHYVRPFKDSWVRTYTWGQGDDVLLVHGWGGRATQFAAMIETLVAQGYRVTAFDAPAHGDSPGHHTNLLEFGALISTLAEMRGGFRAVIGHSLGAVACARALHAGVPAKNLVTLAAPTDIEFILESFAEQVGVTERTVGFIKARLLTLAQESIEEFSLKEYAETLAPRMLSFHDEGDTSVPFAQGETLATALLPGRFIATRGLGHNKILADPLVLERIGRFLR